MEAYPEAEVDDEHSSSRSRTVLSDEWKLEDFSIRSESFSNEVCIVSRTHAWDDNMTTQLLVSI